MEAQRDHEVIAIDDSYLLTLTCPDITAVPRPYAEQSRVAAAMLIDALYCSTKARHIPAATSG